MRDERERLWVNVYCETMRRLREQGAMTGLADVATAEANHAVAQFEGTFGYGAPDDETFGVMKES